VSSVVINRSDESLPTYTWEKIKDGKSWIVIDGFIYDITDFSKKHPGGSEIINYHIGQDASVC
jgi:cytochrome b involved in lipid metabolism